MIVKPRKYTISKMAIAVNSRPISPLRALLSRIGTRNSKITASPMMTIPQTSPSMNKILEGMYFSVWKRKTKNHSGLWGNF